MSEKDESGLSEAERKALADAMPLTRAWIAAMTRAALASQTTSKHWPTMFESDDPDGLAKQLTLFFWDVLSDDATAGEIAAAGRRAAAWVEGATDAGQGGGSVAEQETRHDAALRRARRESHERAEREVVGNPDSFQGLGMDR